MKQITTILLVSALLISTVLGQGGSSGNASSSQGQLCRFAQQFKAVYFSWNTATPQGTYFNRTFDAVDKKMRDDFFVTISGALTRVVQIADYTAGRMYLVLNDSQCIYATIDSNRDINMDSLRCIPVSAVVTHPYTFGQSCDTQSILAVIPSRSIIIYDRMYGLLDEGTGPSTSPSVSPSASPSTSTPASTSSPSIPFPSGGKRDSKQSSSTINVLYPFFSDIVFIDPNQGNTTVIREEWLNYEILTSVDQSIFDVSSLNCQAAPSSGSKAKAKGSMASRSVMEVAQEESWSLNSAKRTLAELGQKMNKQ